MFDPRAPLQDVPELTERQQAVLEVLRSHTAEHGYPPTVREIGHVLGMTSSSTVHSHLAALERAGVIERDPSKPRALKWGPAAPALGIDEAGPEVEPGIGLPLVGRVAAGAPILAEEHVEQYVPVPPQLVRSGSSFLLQVRGDSMVDAGILDGDWVVVRQQTEAQNGEIVVALVGEDAEATCKRLQRRGSVVELHSENPAYEPIVTEQVQLVGIVTGVLRAL